MAKINPKLLISMVEQRPALWDKNLDSYKNKHLKESVWKEICVTFNEDFEKLEEKEKQSFARSVARKWTQIRDSWMRCMKKQKIQKTSESVKPSRLYIYHEQLSFLKNITEKVTRGSIEESVRNIKGENNINELNAKANYRPSSSGIRKKTTEMKNQLDAKIKLLDKQTIQNKEGNRHMSFFQSILPSLKAFNDDEILQFQAGVISLIQKIRISRNTFTQQQLGHINGYSEWQKSNDSVIGLDGN